MLSYFLQEDLTSILWTQKNIFLLPSTFIWTSSICLCISSWLLLLLAVMIKEFEFFFKFQYFCAFFPPEDKIHFDKKNLKQNWVRNSRVICAFVCYTYIHLSLFQEVPKLQIWFSTKKNPEFIFFFVFYKLERIFHLLIQKLPKNLCIILTKFFWSDTIMCNPAFPFSFFSSPTLQIRYIIMKVYDTYIKYMKSCKCQKSINMIVKNKKKFAKKHCFCSSISRYYKNRRYE